MAGFIFSLMCFFGGYVFHYWVSWTLRRELKHLAAHDERELLKYILSVECKDGSFEERAKAWLEGYGGSLLSHALREEVEQALKKSGKD